MAAGLVVRRRRQQSQRRRPAQAKAAAAATAANPLLAEGALSGEENPLAAASGAAAASFRATHAPILVRTPSVASVAGGSARVEALAAAETNLAPGWTAKWSNSRSICYWVSADGTSVWEKPVAKLGDTLVLTDLSLIRNEDVKKAVSLRRAVSGRAVTDEAPAPAPPPAPSADDPGDAAVGLAPGWAPVWSRSREQWYWRDASGNSTWEKPTKLPSGWVEQYSKTRERPYWRHVDGRTVWERPSA